MVARRQSAATIETALRAAVDRSDLLAVSDWIRLAQTALRRGKITPHDFNRVTKIADDALMQPGRKWRVKRTNAK